MKKATNSIKTGWKKAGLCVLIVILSYTVLSMLLSAIVYRELFRHVTPDELDFGYVYNELADECPRKAVCFASGKNTLRGYWYTAGDSPTGLVIVANGIKSPADGHLAEIRYFTDHGFEALAYNGTGVADSDGDSVMGLTQMRLDLAAALTFASENTTLPIVVYGHSAGGYAAASLVDRPELAGVVSVSGFDSPIETMCCKAREYVGPLVTLEKPFLALQHWFVFGQEGSVRAIDSINATDTPIAVYYGKDDTVVPLDASLYSRRDESRNPNARFFACRDGHATVWLTDAAAVYADGLRNEYAALKKKYGGDVPENVRRAFADSIDYDRANELDGAFMEQVLAFFQNAVGS